MPGGRVYAEQAWQSARAHHPRCHFPLLLRGEALAGLAKGRFRQAGLELEMMMVWGLFGSLGLCQHARSMPIDPAIHIWGIPKNISKLYCGGMTRVVFSAAPARLQHHLYPSERSSCVSRRARVRLSHRAFENGFNERLTTCLATQKQPNNKAP